MLLESFTSPEFGERAASGRLIVLVPVGSVEPHGPHLPLGTDTRISLGACERAVSKMAGWEVQIAPSVPYGVTEYASAFPGAVSIPGPVLTAYLRAVVEGFLRTGARHVCLVNNHLEPAQDVAVRAAVVGLRASVACPLTRRWGRRLSPEFKQGACHAGRYETSLVLAQDSGVVHMDVARTLPEVPISLAQKIQEGVTEFRSMGLDHAYAGSPAEATVEEGEALMAILAEMIVGEVQEALEKDGSGA